jgi:class 3 adenylate cyclase/TolB-like protein
VADELPGAASSDERRLAAIVSVDVVGYSLLMGRDESGTLAALRSHRRELVDPKVAEHHGRIVKTMGDGLLLVFASVVDAVRFAVDLQRGMALRNVGIPDDPRIVLRVGIHVGDIIHERDDIFGDGVNVAARLESLAEPGGICVSRAVRDQVLDKLGFVFEDMGARQVKNIVRPVEVYRVALDGATPSAPVLARPVSRRLFVAAGVLAVVVAAGIVAMRAWPPAPVVPYSEQDRRMTFAVLPLDAPANDADARAAAAALTDELRTSQERRTNWARTVSRRSVDDAVARHASLKDIAKALDVHFLMRGNVSRSGSGYGGEIMVVDGASERVLATRPVSAPAASLGVPVKESIDDIAGYLTFYALTAEVERARAKPDTALDVRDLAFRAYVTWVQTKGRGEEKEAYGQAMALLDRALAISPNDQLALMLVARVNLCECVEGWSRDVAEQQAIGAAALDRFAAANPYAPSAIELRFHLAVAQGRYEDALLAAEAMTKVEYGETEGRANQSYALLKLGRYGEAQAVSDGLLGRRGGWPDESLAAAIHYALGQDAAAAQHAQKALLAMGAAEKRSSRYGDVALVLAASEARRGRTEQARQALADFRASVPAVASIAQIRAWTHQAANLAGFEPLYDGLRRAGVPD